MTIRYDPRDLAEIRVFHRGEFLCKAVSPELAAVSISMKDLQAARNQRRRELGQQLIARGSVVDILTEPRPVPVTPVQIPRRQGPTGDCPDQALPRRLTHRSFGKYPP